MNRRVASAAFLVATCATVFAAPPHDLLRASQSVGTGSIAGVTVDQTTGRPVGGVAVYLSFRWIERQTWIERQATSDAGGRFEFRDLPQGEAQFGVRLDGWMTAERASEHPEVDETSFFRPSPQSLPLAPGQRIEDVRLASGNSRRSQAESSMSLAHRLLVRLFLPCTIAPSPAGSRSFPDQMRKPTSRACTKSPRSRRATMS